MLLVLVFIIFCSRSLLLCTSGIFSLYVFIFYSFPFPKYLGIIFKKEVFSSSLKILEITLRVDLCYFNQRIFSM